MKKILQLLVLQLFITNCLAQISVHTARKKALVIGNVAYPVDPLKCPTNDARAMAAFLKKNGFEVTLDSNLNRHAMINVIYHFRQTLSEGDISLFFFAGHGTERHRSNYLYPIDNQLVNLDTCYLSSLESRNCLLNIVLLNACRLESTPMSPQSISPADFNTNVLLSFATAPNQLAYDNKSASGLSAYTESFLNIARKGSTLNDIFPRLVDSVLQKTGNAQRPWVHHSMNSEIANFKLLRSEVFSMKKVPVPNGQSPFSIGQHEVTQAEWKEIMGDNPAINKCDDCPIENVNLANIQSFIKKLNDKTGKKYRLCTEVEWEYAARGGQNTIYSGSDDLEKVGWYLANTTQKTHPVEEKHPNQFGIYDMSGNVWEWCLDTNGDGVLRGGSLGREKDSRLQNRFEQDSSVKSRYYGFRLCED